MEYRCSICDDLYPHVYPDTMDICATCFDKNFAGAQPPLPDGDTMTRSTLDASVDTAHPMTPRQVQALARLAAVWRRQEAEDGTP